MSTEKEIKFYGYKMVQNASNSRLSLYVGAVDASELALAVSVDNEVKWDKGSGVWREQGRNRSIEQNHCDEILEFLNSSNNDKILPNSIIISAEPAGLSFEKFSQMQEMFRVAPGVITLRYKVDVDPNTGDEVPVDEKDRHAWVLDGQHRITAFRRWAAPEPYPVNVVIIKKWNALNYEDCMRHQTYELNMGRPLDNNFKAAVREQYNELIGHTKYRQEIAVSWIRKKLENLGGDESAFSTQIVGASKLRTPFTLQMYTVENLIRFAYDMDQTLRDDYPLESMTLTTAGEAAKYLFYFYEGVRLSIGQIHPSHHSQIGTHDPKIPSCKDYWELCRVCRTTCGKLQKLVHNVGLKAVTMGLLSRVMKAPVPADQYEVAEKLKELRGIPWYDPKLCKKKDDWVPALAEALGKFYDHPYKRPERDRTGHYTLTVKKSSDDSFDMTALKWSE